MIEYHLTLPYNASASLQFSIVVAVYGQADASSLASAGWLFLTRSARQRFSAALD